MALLKHLAHYSFNFDIEESGFLRKGCHRKWWTPRARAEGGGGVYEAIYACAPEDQCFAVGCLKRFRATKCCCNSDYCNSCSTTSLMTAIISIAVLKFVNF
ncbi:hypothetical protein Y032_0008g145 [Ancylostoma ceylanicum]|uniref:Uncharacterized protein n=1 Tax=Ancylostoma ceylanicum TaxID=53326 RepID=A0A016VJD3_9BILA|nr:hypothetical protein Y032_0008g145 [Ancylostoma ceylanicum]